MAGAEALRHVTLGRFFPTDSVIHRLDPRAKLTCAAFLTIGMVVAPAGLVHLALLAVMVAICALARIPARHLLASLKPLLPVLGILWLSQLLFGRGENVSSGAAIAASTVTGRALDAGLAVLRLVNLILLVNMLLATTSVGRLATGLELMLGPLNAIGLPGHQAALVASIALSFLPTVGEDLSTIMSAQASRGLSDESRGRWRWLARARMVAQAIVPLFAGLFRRADEMSEAMLARCYRGGRGRTHLATLAFRIVDWVAVTVSFVVSLGSVAVSRVLGR